MTARLFGVLALIAALLIAPATASAAGEYPPGGCVVTIDVAQPTQGQPFTVTVNVEQPAVGEITTVTFTFDGQTYERPVVNGIATITLIGPGPGSYTGTAGCGPQIVDFDVSVPNITVPPTGSDSTRPALMIGAFVLGLGGMMLLVARRRRHEPAFA